MRAQEIIDLYLNYRFDVLSRWFLEQNRPEKVRIFTEIYQRFSDNNLCNALWDNLDLNTKINILSDLFYDNQLSSFENIIKDYNFLDILYAYSCIHNQIRIIEHLFSTYNITNEQIKLGFVSASESGNLELVKKLYSMLDVNDHANLLTRYSFESITNALKHGHLQIAEYLWSLMNTEELKFTTLTHNRSDIFKVPVITNQILSLKFLSTKADEINQITPDHKRVMFYQMFHSACCEGNSEIIDYTFSLIENTDLQLFLFINSDFEAFYSACVNNRDDIIDKLWDIATLLEQDSEAAGLLNRDGMLLAKRNILFHDLCSNGHYLSAKNILDKAQKTGLLFNVLESKAGETDADHDNRYEYFDIACRYGYFHIIDLIMSFGYDIPDVQIKWEKWAETLSPWVNLYKELKPIYGHQINHFIQFAYQNNKSIDFIKKLIFDNSKVVLYYTSQNISFYEFKHLISKHNSAVTTFNQIPYEIHDQDEKSYRLTNMPVEIRKLFIENIEEAKPAKLLEIKVKSSQKTPEYNHL